MRLDHAGKIQSASLISAADVEEEGEGVQSLEEATASLQILTSFPPIQNPYRGYQYIYAFELFLLREEVP